VKPAAATLPGSLGWSGERGNSHGCHWTDARYSHDPTRTFIALGAECDLAIELRSKYHRGGLLVFRLHPDKPHARTLRRLVNGFSVGGVVLLAFHEWLYVMRCNHPGGVTELGDLRRREMSHIGEI